MSIRGKKRVQVVSVKLVKERNEYYDFKAIKSPDDAYKIFSDFVGNADREMFVVACLNTKNEITNISVVHVGSLNASVVHPREVFKTAILSNSASIICAHNHPSGHPEPSREDVEVTKRLAEAGRILGIELLDHIIVGDERYYSLKEKGHF